MAVVAGAFIGAEALGQILGSLGDISRKTAIGVTNDTNQDWTALNTYFFSGTSDVVLPYDLPANETLIYSAHKTTGPVATGAVGVFAYHMSGGFTLAVMFSVPFDYTYYENWWNVKVYKGKNPADETMYKDLYYKSNPFKGDDSWHEKSLGYGLQVRGCMASSGKATLEICVTNSKK